MIFEFPAKLDAAWLESAVASCDAESDEPVVLDLQRWTETHDFGEGRLLQWMRQLCQAGRRIEVSLGRALPAIEDDPRHRLWRLFRDELGAIIVVDSVAEVLDSEQRDRRGEVADVQRKFLSASGGEVGSGSEKSLLRLDRFGSPSSFRAFVEETEGFSGIRLRVVQLIGALNLSPIDGEQIENLSTFIYEAVDNTRRHACDDLEGTEIGGARFAQIRRHSVTRQRPMDRLMTNDDHLQEYRERLASADGLGDGSMANFIEVTVADSGVGIAARLLGSMDVYNDPLPAETELTLKAMRRGTSSLPPSAIERGEGLFQAMRMANELCGLVVVRSGRLELVRDTTLAPASGQDGWHITERSCLPGTSISLLLPWWHGAQGQLAATR